MLLFSCFFQVVKNMAMIGIMGVRLNEYERLFGVSPFNVCKYAPTGTGDHGDDVIVYVQ